MSTGLARGEVGMTTDPRSGSWCWIGRLELQRCTISAGSSGRCEARWRLKPAALEIAFERFAQDPIPPLHCI